MKKRKAILSIIQTFCVSDVAKFFIKISILTILIINLPFQVKYANNTDSYTLETIAKTEKELNINSRAYIVLDRKSKTILVGKNEHQRRKMASTTKIMTSLLVIEKGNLNDVVEVSKKSANTGGSRLGLHAGNKITVRDLLYGLMLCSGNDAAVCLAEHIGGSVEGFAELMNNKAKELGLQNTHFVTPHGLDSDEHYTTAYELAILSNYALNNKTFCNIVGTKNYTVTINGYPKSISNTNELLGNLSGVYGIKTGFTNGANRCLVTACKRGNMDIICVVLGADTKNFRTQDSKNLIEYAFKNFEYVNIKEKIDKEFSNWKNENINSFNIYKVISNSIDISYNNLVNDIIPVRKDLINDIRIDINADKNLIAPIENGSIIGKINVSASDKTIVETDIITASSIEKKDYINYLYEFLKNFQNYLITLQ